MKKSAKKVIQDMWSAYEKKKAKKHLISISKKDKKIISKAHARGLSSQKILEKYDEKFDYEYTLQQIAAIKAHITMGTY